MSYASIGDTKPGSGVKVRDVAPVAGAVCAEGPIKMMGNWKCACVANDRYACEDGSNWVATGSGASLTDLVAAQDRARGPDWLFWGAIATAGLAASVYFLRK